MKCGFSLPYASPFTIAFIITCERYLEASVKLLLLIIYVALCDSYLCELPLRLNFRRSGDICPCCLIAANTLSQRRLFCRYHRSKQEYLPQTHALCQVQISIIDDAAAEALLRQFYEDQKSVDVIDMTAFSGLQLRRSGIRPKGTSLLAWSNCIFYKIYFIWPHASASMASPPSQFVFIRMAYSRQGGK